MRAKVLIACLVVLGLSVSMVSTAGAMGKAPKKAEGFIGGQTQYVVTPIMATRLGEPEESCLTFDLATNNFAGETIVAELRRKANELIPIPVPPGPIPIPVPILRSEGGSFTRDVLSVWNTKTDPWTKKFEVSLGMASGAKRAVECIVIDNQLLFAVLLGGSKQIRYYNLTGLEVGRTQLPETIDGYGAGYNDIAVEYIGPEPLIIVAGGVWQNPSAFGVARDGTGNFVYRWHIINTDLQGSFTQIEAASDNISVNCVMLSLGIAGERIASALRGATLVSPGTITTLPQDPNLELADADIVVGSGEYIFLAANNVAGGYPCVVRLVNGAQQSIILVEGLPPGAMAQQVSARDWTKEGVKSLSLWFAGGTSSFFLAGGNSPLAGGSGVVYFDDIRLYGGPGGGNTVIAMVSIEQEFGVEGCPVLMATTVDGDQTFTAGNNITLASVGGAGMMDSVIMEIQLKKDPVAMIEALIAKVESMNLHQGIESSLDAKLENTKKSIESVKAGQRQDAANKLQAFVNECYAQRGVKLTIAQADELILAAQAIINALQ